VTFALADRLGKTVSEIEELPYSEILEWMAYIELVNERQRNGRNA
jgi:hypothetical protein